MKGDMKHSSCHGRVSTARRKRKSLPKACVPVASSSCHCLMPAEQLAVVGIWTVPQYVCMHMHAPTHTYPSSLLLVSATSPHDNEKG